MTEYKRTPEQKKIDHAQRNNVHVDFYSAERGRKFSVDGDVTSHQLREIADLADELKFEYAKKPEKEKKRDKLCETIAIIIGVCIFIGGGIFFIWMIGDMAGPINIF